MNDGFSRAFRVSSFRAPRRKWFFSRMSAPQLNAAKAKDGLEGPSYGWPCYLDKYDLWTDDCQVTDVQIRAF